MYTASISAARRPRRARVLAGALPAVAVLLALTVSSGAEPQPAGGRSAVDLGGGATVAVQGSPTNLRYPDRLKFTLTITITTGDQAQKVWIDERAPGWNDPAILGSSIDFGPVSLRGPGQLSFTSVDYSLTAGACIRGALGGLRGIGVSLPPRATTVLVQPIFAATARPWRGVGYTPRLSARLGTGSAIPLAVPAITMTGRRGVHILLRAAPPLQRRPLRPGRPIVIAGATRPALPNARIHVSVRQFGKTGTLTRRLGAVRTDRRGRFRLKAWRPRRLGVFQVVARYVRPRGTRGVRGDSTCGLSFTVARPGR